MTDSVPRPALETVSGSDRRQFLKGAGAVLGGSLLAGANAAAAGPRPLTDEEKLGRLASNTYPLRPLFKRRGGQGPGMQPQSQAQSDAADRAAAMKKKYGEITLLDFPQFTKDRFPGVRHMDLWSSLFGDVDDDSMFTETSASAGGNARSIREFDPSSASGKKWLDRLADKIAAAGVRCHHVSNNAPRNISDLDPGPGARGSTSPRSGSTAARASAPRRCASTRAGRGLRRPPPPPAAAIRRTTRS